MFLLIRKRRVLELTLLPPACVELLVIQAQQLLLTIYRQGLQLAVFFNFHPLLSILHNPLRGDFPAVDHFSRSGYRFVVAHPTATKRRGREGSEAPVT